MRNKIQAVALVALFAVIAMAAGCNGKGMDSKERTRKDMKAQPMKQDKPMKQDRQDRSSGCGNDSCAPNCCN